MKKTIALILAMILALSLFAACGKTEEPATTAAPAADDQTTAAPETEPVSEKEEAGKPHTFVDGVLTADQVIIKITDYKVIPKGQDGNDLNDGDVIEFYYDVTNVAGEDITPMTAWIALIEAVQDNDPNLVNKLEVGINPDGTPDSDFEQIKIGGTVSSRTCYVLTDNVTPVELRAGTIAGVSYGFQTFDITK